MNRYLHHTEERGPLGRCALMPYLFFILSFLCGFTYANFHSAWSGEIEGQLFRSMTGGKVPLTDIDLHIVEDVPGIPECKIAPETHPIFVTTDAKGIFKSGTLKAGPYHICAEFDYEAGPDFRRRLTAIVAIPIYVSRIGVKWVTITK